MPGIWGLASLDMAASQLSASSFSFQRLENFPISLELTWSLTSISTHVPLLINANVGKHTLWGV